MIKSQLGIDTKSNGDPSLEIVRRKDTPGLLLEKISRVADRNSRSLIYPAINRGEAFQAMDRHSDSSFEVRSI